MCGITGIYVKEPGSLDPRQLNMFVDGLLLGIEHRGGDATGILSIKDEGKGTILHKEDKTAALFVKTRPQLQEDVRIVLGHTRFATQGHQSQNVNNHPVVYNTCFAVHNGHISNDDLLFKAHDLTRLGEVDSEAIPAVISQFGFDRVEEALEQLRGGMAIAVADPVNNPDEVILAKGMNSPLYLLNHPLMYVWGSTVQAIRDAWGAVFGTPPQVKRFQQVFEGEVVFLNPGGITWGNFTVAPPLYTKTYAERLAASQRYNGGTSYADRWADSTVALQCNACDVWKPKAQMDFIGTLYNICDECSVPGNQTTRKLLEQDDFIECQGCMDYFDVTDGVYFGSNFVCDECVEDLSKDGEFFGQEKSGGSCELVPFPGTVISNGKPQSERRHEHLLDCVAVECQYPAEFVDYVLFKAPLELFEVDSHLSELRDDFEREFCFAEDLLNQFEQLGGDLDEYLERQEQLKRQEATA